VVGIGSIVGETGYERTKNGAKILSHPHHAEDNTEGGRPKISGDQHRHQRCPTASANSHQNSIEEYQRVRFSVEQDNYTYGLKGKTNGGTVSWLEAVAEKAKAYFAESTTKADQTETGSGYGGAETDVGEMINLMLEYANPGEIGQQKASHHQPES